MNTPAQWRYRVCEDDWRKEERRTELLEYGTRTRWSWKKARNARKYIEKIVPKVSKRGFPGGEFVLKSGLRILIRATQVPYSVPPKMPKWVILGGFGYFGGTENGTLGAWIKILRPLSNTNTPPKTPISTFWEPFWTPEKWFLAILLILVIFPLKFPLKPKIFITMGRSWAREKTKCVLRPVKQWEQLGNMHNWSFRNFWK